LKSSKKLIAQILKQLRIKNDLTLEELAQKLNTDRHYIWKLENGKINMSLDYLDKILTVLKCSQKEFFKMVNVDNSK
jgi:transcriptional regulator with XRE-family HTH domain